MVLHENSPGNSNVPEIRTAGLEDKGTIVVDIDSLKIALGVSGESNFHLLEMSLHIGLEITITVYMCM